MALLSRLTRALQVRTSSVLALLAAARALAIAVHSLLRPRRTGQLISVRRRLVCEHIQPGHRHTLLLVAPHAGARSLLQQFKLDVQSNQVPDFRGHLKRSPTIDSIAKSTSAEARAL